MQTTSRIPTHPNKSFFAMNRWFKQMYLSGLLFHPDEPAESIINIASGQPSFTPAECIQLNSAIQLMFDNHGDRVYSVCLKYFHMAMGIKPDYSST